MLLGIGLYVNSLSAIINIHDFQSRDSSLVPRLSFSEGRREPGNIGGVKPLTSGASSFM